MQKESLKQQAYNAIKAKILNCEYAPNTFINEELLREEGVGQQNAGPGCHQQAGAGGAGENSSEEGNHGLRSVFKPDQYDIYETRMMLEPYAILDDGNRIEQDVYMKYYQDYQAYLRC